VLPQSHTKIACDLTRFIVTRSDPNKQSECQEPAAIRWLTTTLARRRICRTWPLISSALLRQPVQTAAEAVCVFAQLAQIRTPIDASEERAMGWRS
jgi:hypothetical protein